MRYDFPKRELAIRRATIRARRRGQPMYVFRSAFGYSISFTEPTLHRQFERVDPAGRITLWQREGLREACEVMPDNYQKTRKPQELTTPEN